MPQKEICDDDIDQNCNGSDLACVCDDGKCEGKETADSCPQDCPGTCGDDICNEFFETVSSCNIDCPGTCGDGYCNTYFENQTNCLVDCPMEDIYEENDTYDTPYDLGLWVEAGSGCLSNTGIGISNDDDYYWFGFFSMVTSIDISLISGDTSGELDLCACEVEDIVPAFCEPPGCSGTPGNNEKLSYYINISPDSFSLDINVKLISGSPVLYDLCWTIQSSCGDGYCQTMEYCPNDCACECGDSLCSDNYSSSGECREAIPGRSEYCPVDCGCQGWCGDRYCDWYCGETRKNCPKDCK